MKGIMSELAAAILSIKEPHLDLSNPAKLYAQELPLSNYADWPDKKFPIAMALIENERAELVANNRYEIASSISISVIYKINPKKESVTDGVMRGRNCLMQIISKLTERQTSGEALLPLYPSGETELDATADYGIDHKETDLLNGAATAKFTMKQIHIKEET